MSESKLDIENNKIKLEQYHSYEEANFFYQMENGGLICFVGSKGSGKTTFLNSLLTYYLTEHPDYFDVMLLVLPSFKREVEDKYKFLKDYKKRKPKITVYESYSELLTHALMNRKKQVRTLLLLDDATGEKLYSQDNEFIRLIVQLRHMRTTLLCAVHSVRSIMSTTFRNNISFLLLFDITNAYLLRTMWEEWFSLRFKKFIDFENVYEEHSKLDHGIMGFVLNTKPKKIDMFVHNWHVFKKYRVID